MHRYKKINFFILLKMETKKSVPLWAWIVMIILAITTIVFFISSRNNVEDYGYEVNANASAVVQEQTSLFPEKKFSLEACPQGLITDKYYGDYRPLLSKYNNVKNYTLQDHIEEFESDINNNGDYVISTYNDAEKQGIQMQINCYKSDQSGTNVNYIYCGDSSFNNVRYTTPQSVDENGIIQPQRYYELKWMIDKRECRITGESVSELYGGWIAGAKFECKFKELGCVEIAEEDRIFCSYDYYDCEDFTECSDVLEVLGECQTEEVFDIHDLYKEEDDDIPCETLCGYRKNQ